MLTPCALTSLSMLSFRTEADPGTWCGAGDEGCMIYEEAFEVEGVVAGTGCRPLPFLEFKFEPEPERDWACPALWLQGFRLLLKSWALARYHRPELNDCLVISDATPPQPSSSPPLPPDAGLAICLPQSHAPGEAQHRLNTSLARFLGVMLFPLLCIQTCTLFHTTAPKSLLVLLHLNISAASKHMFSPGDLFISINSPQVLL